MTVSFLKRQNLTPLGVFLIDQWRQIGVTVNHDQPENARFLESRLNANFDILIDALQLVLGGRGDAGVVRELLDVPLVGAFCQGELGPVAGRNAIHAFTATIVTLPV